MAVQAARRSPMARAASERLGVKARDEEAEEGRESKGAAGCGRAFQ